ncbi:MAG: YkgJ family cysteine cluster protein, partial [Deltaproteobacteria bacterium]|nr:YkgJ family cysteine cluster protein [Deltaproteobacteria bacterium]
SGYVWVSPQELQAMADALDLDTETFEEAYLNRTRHRHSIKEIPYLGGFRCAFFDPTKTQCSIYEVRPVQCRTFPFWECFRGNIGEVEKECPGVGRV